MMAVVNPPINPTNEPKYGNDSRAIDTPDPIKRQGVQYNQILPEGQKIGDVSAQYEGQAAGIAAQADSTAMKGYGDLFANIVGIGDFIGKAGVQMVKKDIENRVYEVADKERQAYTAELESIKAKGTKNLLDANASMDEVPEDISDLPDTLNTLKAARDGGKISKVDYQGRLLEAAKSLRAQYPGFKNEIDQEFAKVTGQNPANARINSLISDINRAAASNSSEQNKMLTYIRSAATAGVPRAEEMYAGYLEGKFTALDVVKHVAKYSQFKERLNIRSMEYNDKKMTREEGFIKGKEDADFALGGIVASAADTLLGKLGLSSPEEVAKLDGLQKAGQIPSQRWAQLNQEAASSITQMRVTMAADMDRTGTTKRIGGIAERNKMIEEAIKPLIAIQDRIINRDFGGIHSAATEAKTVLDDTEKALLTDSKAGPIFASQAVMKKLGGELYLQKFNLEQALGPNGLPKAYGEWYKRWVSQIHTQGGKADPAAVTTYNDMFNEMKAKGINNDKINRNIVKEVEKIGSSETPDGIAASIAKAAFSPGNRGFISKLNVDGYDANGKPTSGQNAVFSRWTSPEVTNRIKKLSAKDPELWYNYTTWAKETFGNELLSREIGDLSKITKDPNIKIEWDHDNKRFEATRTTVPQLQANFREGRGGEGLNTSEQVANIQQFNTVRASIARINAGLYNLKNVAKEDTKESDVDAFLLSAISNAAGPDALKNVQGIPVEMLNKIMLGRAYGGSKR